MYDNKQSKLSKVVYYITSVQICTKVINRTCVSDVVSEIEQVISLSVQFLNFLPDE